MSIDDDSGIWLLLSKNKIQRLAYMLQIIGSQSLIAVGRHKACRNMQCVPLLKRQVERSSKQLHHIAARLRAAGFQEA